MENELENIMREIVQMESEIAIRRNRTKELETEVNTKKMEEQAELDEVSRLQACQQSMKTKLSMKQEQISQANAKEEFDNFMNDLGGMLR